MNENQNPTFKKQNSINTDLTDFGGDNYVLPQIQANDQKQGNSQNNGRINKFKQPVISMNAEEKANLQQIVANSVQVAQNLEFKPFYKNQQANQIIKQQQKIRRKGNFYPKPPIQKRNNKKRGNKLYQNQQNYLLKAKKSTRNTMNRIRSQQRKRRQQTKKLRKRKSTPRTEYKRKKVYNKKLPSLQKFMRNNNQLSTISLDGSRKKSRSRRKLKSGQPYHRNRGRSNKFKTNSQKQSRVEEEKQIILEVDPLLEKTNETVDQPWIRYQFSQNQSIVPLQSSIKYEANRIQTLHQNNQNALNEMMLYKQMLLDVEYDKQKLEQKSLDGVFKNGKFNNF